MLFAGGLRNILVLPIFACFYQSRLWSGFHAVPLAKTGMETVGQRVDALDDIENLSTGDSEPQKCKGNCT